MYVIVIGCGRVGAQLAKSLASEGHNVVVVDKDASSFRRLGSTFNGLTLEGMGFDEEVLQEAGIEKADAVAVVTDLDNTNLMITEMATKLFGVERTIARLYNPEKERAYQQLGLEYVCGTLLTAERILDKIVRGYSRHLPVGSDSEIIEFEASKNLEGKKVSEIEVADEIKISAIVRKGKAILPDGETSIQENDHIFCAVRRWAIPKINGFIQG